MLAASRRRPARSSPILDIAALGLANPSCIRRVASARSARKERHRPVRRSGEGGRGDLLANRADAERLGAARLAASRDGPRSTPAAHAPRAPAVGGRGGAEDPRCARGEEASCETANRLAKAASRDEATRAYLHLTPSHLTPPLSTLFVVLVCMYNVGMYTERERETGVREGV